MNWKQKLKGASMEKTLQQYQQEYGQLAGQFGDLTYRIEMMKNDWEAIKEKMVELNREAAKLQAADKAKPDANLKAAEEMMTEMLGAKTDDIEEAQVTNG